MKSHLLAKKRRREDLNLAVCWTVSVTVPLCWTSTNIISMCNTFCTCSVSSGCSFAQWRYVTWDAREADFCWGRRAKTSSCLPKSCQVMKTTLQQGWPGILCQQRRQIFSTGEVLFSFVMPAWQGRSIWLGAVQRQWIIDEISFKSKVESCKIGIYMKVLSTTL